MLERFTTPRKTPKAYDAFYTTKSNIALRQDTDVIQLWEGERSGEIFMYLFHTNSILYFFLCIIYLTHAFHVTHTPHAKSIYNPIPSASARSTATKVPSPHSAAHLFGPRRQLGSSKRPQRPRAAREFREGLRGQQ